MKRLFREPLVHFVLIALLVFAGYRILSDLRSDADKTIYVSTADMERMAALYATEAGALPGADDIRAMVSDHVQQEALVREARRLGLDQGDIVVERRLAQKMSFMVADLAEPVLPDEAALRAWYEDSSEKFRQSAMATFQHVFFVNSDDPRIAGSLAQLNADNSVDWRSLGDPFILQREYANLPQRETTRLFGASLAGAIFNIDQGVDAWFGPVASPYGVHFYRVSSLTEGVLPSFETARGAVERDWLDINRAILNAEAISEIIGKYDVVIEGAEP